MSQSNRQLAIRPGWKKRGSAGCLGDAGHPELRANWQQQRREKRFDVEYVRKVKPTEFA